MLSILQSHVSATLCLCVGFPGFRNPNYVVTRFRVFDIKALILEFYGPPYVPAELIIFIAISLTVPDNSRVKSGIFFQLSKEECHVAHVFQHSQSLRLKQSQLVVIGSHPRRALFFT